MQYYIWSIYEAGSGFAFCEDLGGITEMYEDQIILGQKIDPMPDDLKIQKLSEGDIGDSIGTVWGLHIVADHIMKKLPEDEVQIIPVDIDGESNKNYFLIYTEEISNLDMEKSEVEMSDIFPDEVGKVKKMVLKEFKDKAPMIYKLEEVPSCIVISELLKLEIESVTNSGGEFIKVEDYTQGYY